MLVFVLLLLKILASVYGIPKKISKNDFIRYITSIEIDFLNRFSFNDSALFEPLKWPSVQCEQDYTEQYRCERYEKKKCMQERKKTILVWPIVNGFLISF